MRLFTSTSHGRFTDLGLFLLRVSAGLMMLFGHGLPKLMKFGDLSESFSDPLGVGSLFSLILAISAEAGASVLITLGLFTRWAAIPLLITMLVAGFIVHGTDPFSTQEKAFLYATIYTLLLSAGPGRYSLDNLIRVRLRR